MGPSQMVWISGSMTDFFGRISTFFVDFSPFHYFIGQIIISFAGFNPLPTPSCYSRVWSIAYLLVLLIIPHLLVMSPCLLLLSWCTTNLYQWSLDSCLPKSLIPFLLVWFITFISHYCFYPLLYFTILHHTLPKNKFVFVASSGFWKNVGQFSASPLLGWTSRWTSGASSTSPWDCPINAIGQQ